MSFEAVLDYKRRAQANLYQCVAGDLKAFAKILAETHGREKKRSASVPERKKAA